MKSEKCAFWVQAIGAIAAVWAAFLISNAQFRLAIRTQAESARTELERRHATLIALLESALEDFGDILKILRGQRPTEAFVRTSAKELMKEYSSAFAELSPLDMPSARAVRSLVKLRDLLKTASWNANEAIRRGTLDQVEYEDCVEAMADNLKEVRTEMEQLILELPSRP